MSLREILGDDAAYFGPSWPLDRSVGVNPLHGVIHHDSDAALDAVAARLGTSTWPSASHFDEARRRDIAVTTPDVPLIPSRPGTVAERQLGDAAATLVTVVGSVLLELATSGDTSEATSQMASILRSRTGWSGASRRLRRRAAELLLANDDELLAPLARWSRAGQREELARHGARLVGWMSWAAWSDEWMREAHHASISRENVLRLSLAVDLAALEVARRDSGEEPSTPSASTAAAVRRSLDDAVHADMLERLSRPSQPSPRATMQVVTCIDVRSEVLRRALEHDSQTATIGFAGFFGLPAAVVEDGASETREGLPVLVAPSVQIRGGVAPSGRRREALALAGTMAELTHEPEAMFAVAEGAGWIAAPWLIGGVVAPRLRPSGVRESGEWRLVADDVVSLAEGALRGMGLTKSFADDVVLLGHTATTAANTHAAALQCGACAGHGGGPNAAALARELNDAGVRAELRRRGIDIPTTTRFWAGEHNTTSDEVNLFGEPSPALRGRFATATAMMRRELDERWHDSVGEVRRGATVRTRDVADLRPEWGLANHAAFVIGPRSSWRGVDLAGRAFLHSYEPDSDPSGEILAFILSAPVVVGQWINATYFFSSVSPDVLGAGDKTLLNPVGDFGVISGTTPQLRVGLPWQSVAVGDRPFHLPTRLLVAVEAPLARIEVAVRASATVRALVDNGWVRLVGRASAQDEWHFWQSGVGFGVATEKPAALAC